MDSKSSVRKNSERRGRGVGGKRRNFTEEHPGDWSDKRDSENENAKGAGESRGAKAISDSEPGALRRTSY